MTPKPSNDKRQNLNKEELGLRPSSDGKSADQDTIMSSDKDMLIAELLDQLRIERERNDRQQKKIEKLEWQWEEAQRQWEDDRKQWEDDRKQWEDERTDTGKQIEDLNRKIEDLGLQLKKAMNIIPSSERGALLDNQNTAGAGSGGQDDGDSNSGGGNGQSDDTLPPESASAHELRYRQAISRPRPKIPEGL